MDNSPAWIEKVWSDTPLDLVDTLVAEFKVATGEEAQIRAEFYWQGDPQDRYPVEILGFGNKVKLYHTFVGNNVTLSGWLQRVTLMEGRANDNNGIFGDIHLAGSERWHYEGMMVAFHWGTRPPQPVPPVPPIPPPGPEPPPPDPESPVEVEEWGGELFPYIYMRPWPRISDRDLVLHFVDYRSGPSSSGVLYAKLIGSPPPDRFSIEQQAVAYLNGDGNWQGQFVEDVYKLPGICGRFPALARYARDLRDRGLDQAVADIARLLDLPEEKWADCLASAEYLATLARLQDSYFALVIVAGYDRPDLSILTEALAAANLFAALVGNRSVFVDDAVFRAMARAAIVLPQAVFPLPPYPASPPRSEADGEWIEPYAIGDLQMVRHRLVRYQPGEIAAIANVLKGERREVRSRNLQTARETVRDEVVEESRLDHEDRAGRTDLASAIEKTIADTVTITDYDPDKGFKTTYGPPSTVTFDGSWSVEKKGVAGGDPAREEVARFARRILSRTVQRVQRRIHRVREVISANENEETVISVFDNVSGESNLYGVYRWLNKVYRVSVVHYGTRLMIEFLLTRPAAEYIRTELRLHGVSCCEPLPPEHFGVFSHLDITSENYATLAAYYRVTELAPPPLARRVVSAGLTANQNGLVSLPEGYQAVSAVIEAAELTGAARQALAGLVGSQPFSLESGGQGVEVTLNRELETVPVALTSGLTLASPPGLVVDCYLNVEITCVPSAVHWAQWQIGIYGGIVKGYRQRRQEYHRRPGNDAAPSPVRSSQSCRRIERSVLRERCMALLLSRHERLVGVAGQGEEPSPFAVNRPRYLRFFENVFEWREMTYDFSLALDGDDLGGGSRASLAGMAGDDELFARFLQAGQARVLVPANPRHAMAVLYYLTSAMIMPVDNSVVPVHGADVAIANDLRKAGPGKIDDDGRVSSSWEEVVPTIMQVLQDGGTLPGVAEDLP
ncbi:MAG: hypothetical protein OEV73_04590 [Desulfobulbaceae bacterium]|nr:hypothetical protein [Desulfobulbaceae bacterium]